MFFRRLNTKRIMPFMASKSFHHSTKETTMDDMRKKIVGLENELKSCETTFAFFSFANLTIGTIAMISLYGSGSRTN